MKFDPTPEQVKIDQHLFDTPQAYLAIGMGIGKTSGCLYHLADRVMAGEFKGALVVAPKAVCNLTWPGEVKLWDDFAWMKTVSLRTWEGRRAFKRGDAIIYTINYDNLQWYSDFIKGMKRHQLPYDVEIWDEITRAKNASSKRIQAFRKAVPRCAHRWGLTGTPAPNGLLDLFAQIRLLDDGKHLGQFITHYEKQYFETDFSGYKKTPKPGADDEIKNRIAGMSLAIDSDWPVHFEDVMLELPPTLKQQYKEFQKKMVLNICGKDITAVNAAALTTKLLQFTSGAVYDETRSAHLAHEIKVQALKKIQQQAKSPVLVGYYFQHEIERMRAAFPHAEFFCDARSPNAQRMLLDKWNSRKIPMLFAHPASVGHGLNMQHGGHTLVYTTLTYNGEHYQQMIRRLARRGQPNTVQVYRLIFNNTIDEVVAAALEDKNNTDRRLVMALKMMRMAA